MKKIHYAWVICAIGMIMMVCNMGLSSNILSVYLPFIEQNRITGAQGSSIISIRCLSTFVGTFFVSWYYEKLSLRNGLTLATVMSGIGIVLFAFAGGNIWIYYLGAIILGIGYAFGTMFGISLLIKNWFSSAKGTALGLCSMGTGLATILFTPFITSNTLKNGLASSCLVQAGFMFLCAVLAFVFIRTSPEEKGLAPYSNGKNTKEKKTVENRNKVENFTIPTLIWGEMLLMMFFMGGAGQTCSSHISIAVSTAGYTKQIAGISTTIYGVFLIVGKVSYGPLADKIGSLKATIVSILFFFAASFTTLWLNGTSLAPIYIFPVLLGLGCPFFTVGCTLWAEDLSPSSSFEKTLKWFQIMYSAGGIVVTAIPGRIADVTGEYKSSYLLLSAMLLIALLLLLSFYKKRKTGYRKKMAG